jgi:hypothetical protein
MNKHEWAARQKEKPKPRPDDEESHEGVKDEDGAAGAASLSKTSAPVAPDS